MLKIRNLIVVFAIVSALISCNDKQPDIKKSPEKDLKKINPLEKWEGIYRFTINDTAKDWREEHYVTLKISQDSIIYESEGYQLWEKYLLYVSDKKDSLKFTFREALENTQSVYLDSIKDFGTLRFDGKNYTWKCPYITLSLDDGNFEKEYVLKKK